VGRKVTLVGLSFTLIVLADSATGQEPRILVGPPSHISSDHPTDPYAETLLAINPRNHRNLIATSMVSRNGETQCDVYASFDGGRSWKRGRGPADEPLIFAGLDPVVFFNDSGMAFFARMGPGVETAVLLSRSTDGGRTWERHGIVSHTSLLFDRPYLVVDQTGGKYHGRMYAAGWRGGRSLTAVGHSGAEIPTLSLAISTDSGRTFHVSAMVVGGPTGELPLTPGDLLVMRDGTVLVPFTTWTKQTQPEAGSSGAGAVRGDGHVGIAVSRNGGQTFTAVRLGPRKSWGQRTGLVWEASSTPRAALDMSNGRFDGRLYVTWVDYDTTRGQWVVKMAFSSDTAKTWSSPVIVHDDLAKRAPMVNPVIAVNNNGIVGLSWIDGRDDIVNECYRLYFTASTDGGVTLLANVPGSDQPTCGRVLGNWKPTWRPSDPSPPRPVAVPLDRTTLRPRRTIHVNAGWASGGFYISGGHTMGMVTDSAGVFHVAWSNGPSGVSQLWGQRFAVTPAPSPTPVADSTLSDFTEQVELIMSEPRIDATAKTISVTVQLRNRLTSPISGRLALILDEMGSIGLRDLRVSNADNNLTGRGASWNFTTPTSDQLLPGVVSLPRTLKWTFEDGDWRGSAMDSEAQLQPLRASFIIVANKK